jgi:thioredoxin 1
METFKDLEEYKDKIDKMEYIVLFFTAAWCGPCKVMYPLIEKLSENMDNCKFYKIDVDEESTEEIVDLYGVQSMPTFYFIKNGEVKDKLIGANKDKFTEVFTLFMKDLIEEKEEEEEKVEETDKVPEGFSCDGNINFLLVDNF